MSECMTCHKDVSYRVHSECVECIQKKKDNIMMGHKLHEYEWDAELDMGDVFDDIKEDKVKVKCAATDCMYEKDGLCTLEIACPFQYTPREDKKVDTCNGEPYAKKGTVDVYMLMGWLEHTNGNFPVYVEIDGCRVEATGLLITANEIVLISDESGAYV